MTAPFVSGYCGTEDLVRQGVVASTSTPDDFHKLCPGATTSNGRTTVCSCPHHEGEDIVADEFATSCTRCGYSRVDSGRKATSNGFRCVDVEACNIRYETKMAENPAFRNAVEFRERMEEQKLAIAKAESEAGVTGSGTARPKYGRCEWSGLPTKGGRFLPGNDAKLKSRLLELAVGGSAGSMAELIARGWCSPDRFVHDSTEALISKACEAAQEEDFVQRRVEARWKRTDDGSTPREAVR